MRWVSNKSIEAFEKKRAQSTQTGRVCRTIGPTGPVVPSPLAGAVGSQHINNTE